MTVKRLKQTFTWAAVKVDTERQRQWKQCGPCRETSACGTPNQLQSGNSGNQHLGLLCLGDQEFPISRKLFDKCSQSKAFVTRMSTAWRKKHSEPVGGAAIEPQSEKVARQCGSFCYTSSEINSSEDLYNSCRGLLINVCRSLKPRYKQIKKEITAAEARHPLLLSRFVSLDERKATAAKGWIITRATFSPYGFDAIELDISASVASGCKAQLQAFAVFRSNLTTFDFKRMDSIAADLTALGRSREEGSLEYCFDPTYAFDWRSDLTTLRIGDVEWVSATYLSQTVCGSFHESDHENEDDGEQGSEDEAADISGLVDALLSLPAKQKAKPKSKSKSKAEKVSCSWTQPRATDN